MSGMTKYSPSTEGLQAEPVAALAAPSKMEHALAHAQEGWHVFPCYEALPGGGCACRKPVCDRKGKHPRTRNGLKDATTDPVQIMAWWTHTNSG
jgi:Bifunctional DNA primase/polymerase, N-terminal